MYWNNHNIFSFNLIENCLLTVNCIKILISHISCQRRVDPIAAQWLQSCNGQSNWVTLLLFRGTTQQQHNSRHICLPLKQFRAEQGSHIVLLSFVYVYARHSHAAVLPQARNLYSNRLKFSDNCAAAEIHIERCRSGFFCMPIHSFPAVGGSYRDQAVTAPTGLNWVADRNIARPLTTTSRTEWLFVKTNIRLDILMKWSLKMNSS